MPNESVLQDAADCTDPIFPSDLLTLGIGATVVRDGYLVDAYVFSSDLGSDFWLEAETVFLNTN